MPTATKTTPDTITTPRIRRRLGLLGRLAGATTVLVVAAGVAVAAGAIPDIYDQEVHLCFAKDSAAPTAVTIFDHDKHPSACPSSKTHLVINQQGVPGPMGPPGPSAAYAVHGSSKLINSFATDVLEKAVPAGTYAISAKGWMRKNPIGGGQLRMHCYLAAVNDTLTLDDTGYRGLVTGTDVPFVLQGQLTTTQPSMIRIICGHDGTSPPIYNGEVSKTAITAIKVGALH